MLGCGGRPPDLALRAQVDVPDSPMTLVAEGVLDIAVLYAPQHRQGLKIELLFEEKLVLVTTDPDASRLPASLAIGVSLIVY
jgi:LysR family transcriptional regulator, flagellar master operon regulator